MRCSIWIGIAIVCLGAARARAQVIYLPVQYQYGGQSPYYYGGDDPLIFAYGDALTHQAGWGRTQGYAFHSGNVETHREVSSEPPRVFTDQLPLQNAAVYGYTATDARNEAYARVARYFRKKDLIAAGRVERDEQGNGVLIAPAHAQPTPAAIVPPVPGAVSPVLVVPVQPPRKPAVLIIVSGKSQAVVCQGGN